MNNAKWMSKIDIFNEHGLQIVKGIGVAIAGAGVIDYAVNDSRAHIQTRRNTNIQERNNKQRDKEQRRRYHTPQELYNYKTGHTNSWGGNKY